MNEELIQELILLHLYNKSNHLDNIQIVKHNNGYLFNYTSLHFTYFGHRVEIRIYNSTFIKIKIDDSPGVVKDNLTGVRNYIDSLDYRY